jgi:hypothetical protein
MRFSKKRNLAGQQEKTLYLSTGAVSAKPTNKTKTNVFNL